MKNIKRIADEIKQQVVAPITSYETLEISDDYIVLEDELDKYEIIPTWILKITDKETNQIYCSEEFESKEDAIQAMRDEIQESQKEAQMEEKQSSKVPGHYNEELDNIDTKTFDPDKEIILVYNESDTYLISDNYHLEKFNRAWRKQFPNEPIVFEDQSGMPTVNAGNPPISYYTAFLNVSYIHPKGTFSRDPSTNQVLLGDTLPLTAAVKRGVAKELIVPRKLVEKVKKVLGNNPILRNMKII